MPSVTIVRIEILVFVSLLFGAGDACLNTQVKETPKCTNGLCVPTRFSLSWEDSTRPRVLRHLH